MAENTITNPTHVRYGTNGTNADDNGVLIVAVNGTPSNGIVSIDLSGYGLTFKYNVIACPTNTQGIYVTGAYVENNVLKIRSNATAATWFNAVLSYRV